MADSDLHIADEVLNEGQGLEGFSTIGKKGEEEEHPWPYLKSMFRYNGRVGRENKSIKFICCLCSPLVREISAFISSPSNLRKHVQRQHPHHLKRYTELTSLKKRQKRAKESEPCTSSNPPAKQLRVYECKTNTVSQKKVDRLILNFTTEGLQPFSIVGLSAFKELVTSLSPGKTVMCRETVKNRLKICATDMKHHLCETFESVMTVATTTDCWSARGKSYIGVTAHWINADDMKRISAALACQRLKGSHTFDVLASALENIHNDYGIGNKICKTTTDNGSNFIKAFSLFGTDNVTNTNEMEVNNEDDEDELIATGDADQAEENATYKKFSRSAFAKCQALWNLSSRSVLAAEAVQSKCGIALTKPNKTRWNSVYRAVERLVRIIKEKGEESFQSLCNELKLPRFKAGEIRFLQEYYKSMQPFAQALDILQAEDKAYMGYLLPVLYMLQDKLKKKRDEMNTCSPLIDALQTGITRRFSAVMQEPEMVAAAILHPKFRKTWTNDTTVLEKGMVYIKRKLTEIESTERTTSVESAGSASDEGDDDAFFFPQKKQSSSGRSGLLQLEEYLSSQSTETSSITTWPLLKDLFIKTNTAQPASAACERLFSAAGRIFTPLIEVTYRRPEL
ncbi:transposase [Paramuricea clavata]|uniref:Transposase n=1 Tax=Paramuricea clavata TaxID=317549 RepID=A0A6S7HF47_PARCT|nr:transposase [Paramuricea clavata]